MKQVLNHGVASQPVVVTPPFVTPPKRYVVLFLHLATKSIPHLHQQDSVVVMNNKVCQARQMIKYTGPEGAWLTTEAIESACEDAARSIVFEDGTNNASKWITRELTGFFEMGTVDPDTVILEECFAFDRSIMATIPLNNNFMWAVSCTVRKPHGATATVVVYIRASHALAPGTRQWRETVFAHILGVNWRNQECPDIGAILPINTIPDITTILPANASL